MSVPSVLPYCSISPFSSSCTHMGISSMVPSYDSGPAQRFFLLKGSLSFRLLVFLGVRLWVSVKGQVTARAPQQEGSEF